MRNQETDLRLNIRRFSPNCPRTMLPKKALLEIASMAEVYILGEGGRVVVYSG